MYFQKWYEEFSKFLPEHIWKSKNWDFDGILLSKVDNLWAWNLEKSFVSWQWRMMQNLNRNWLVSSKLTWEIAQFLRRHSKIWRIHTLMSSFWPEYKMFEIKKYRGDMFDDTEFWCKIWRKTDLRFQKWHEEFIKFLPEQIWKHKNWDFAGVLISKVENIWA